MQQYTDRAAASALAMPPVPMLATGEKWLGAAVGSYGGAQALGIAFAYQPNRNLNTSLGVSAATGGKVGVRVHAGWRW
jgi:hypothetical protein